MEQVKIADRWVGDGERCLIIAEAGSNHNGRLDQAIRLIDVAAAAGADSVKFQFFQASKVYPRTAGSSDYLKMPKSIYEIVSELEMPYDWLSELKYHCQETGVLFLASVFDEQSVDLLDPFVDAFKIASYEITHVPLVRHVANKRKPVIVSTGASDIDEVAGLVDEFRRSGNDGLILMQCTAAYPAPLQSLNVRSIATMKSTFGVPVGLSDHSRDPLVGPLAAVAVGANLIEKHFTLSNELPGPDHRFAVEPPELRVMVQKVREVEAALGSAEKVIDPVEAELRRFARRSVFAIQDIPDGAELTSENIAVLRCGKLSPGVAPKHYPNLLGRNAKRNISLNTAIRPEDIE
ncbi:MAG: shikimate dehydrogenase [Chloroflexota bacterium]|nr:MAG: shikimate dehydrogenase [Chloroflexota bacterium]